MANSDDPKKIKVQMIGDPSATMYVNNVEMAFSAWDIRIQIGEVLGQKDGELVGKNLGTVVMAPAHAKAFLEALKTTMSLFEEKFGEIDMARIKEAGFSPS